MNYLIITSSPESKDCAEILTEEIRRFDIRAEIYCNSNSETTKVSEDGLEFEIAYSPIKPTFIQAIKFDLLVVIGESFDRNLIRRIKNQGGKTCYFLQTANYNTGIRSHRRALKSFDKAFVDLPIYDSVPKSEIIGHYLNDTIRKYEFSQTDSEGLVIGIVIGEHRNLNRLIYFVKIFSKRIKSCQWNIHSSLANEVIRSKLDSLNVNLNSNKLDTLKNSNAVIVDSEIDSIAAAFMNCPQISISGKHGLLGFTKTEKPLVNEILGQNVVKNFKPNQFDLIQEELNLLLNNHEYCASMLASYQDFKNKIGTQPVVRTAAQTLVNWMEEVKS
ncbi:hypothetical protein [Ekhidna sp. To15]|uniref:hypothetical protein n=1 Tax=Ekhidna sp. To15 TaxID=3395267 RepID=UPI003F528C69